MACTRAIEKQAVMQLQHTCGLLRGSSLPESERMAVASFSGTGGGTGICGLRGLVGTRATACGASSCSAHAGSAVHCGSGACASAAAAAPVLQRLPPDSGCGVAANRSAMLLAIWALMARPTLLASDRPGVPSGVCCRCCCMLAEGRSARTASSCALPGEPQSEPGVSSWCAPWGGDGGRNAGMHPWASSSPALLPRSGGGACLGGCRFSCATRCPAPCRCAAAATRRLFGDRPREAGGASVRWPAMSGLPAVVVPAGDGWWVDRFGKRAGLSRRRVGGGWAGDGHSWRWVPASSLPAPLRPPQMVGHEAAGGPGGAERRKRA